MCGIAGVVGRNFPGLVKQMNDTQAHRGPDGSGILEWVEEGVALAHRRLAILDLSDAAAQPMTTRDGRYSIVFNGEIYNFQELKQNLTSRGHTFRSSGDTEVLLAGLREYGTGFLNRLNGIFAFGLWDSVHRTLLLGRDQLGVKPLYYAHLDDGSLLFASEIKALLRCRAVKRDVDEVALYQHLTYGYCFGSHTMIKGVSRLSPGHILEWDAQKRSSRVQPYWTLQLKPRISADFDSEAHQLAHLLDSATRRQMISDVPVGAFLSGGLDSSMIVTLASKYCTGGFRSYTVGFPMADNTVDQYGSDAPFARALARAAGVEHVEITINPKMAELLPNLVYHLDEPLADPAIISTYLVSKLAKDNGTTVLLSGQGADELFGGYARYQIMGLMPYISWLPLSLRNSLARIANIIPASREGALGALMRRYRRALREIGKAPGDQFFAYCANVETNLVLSVLSPDIRTRVSMELDAFVDREVASCFDFNNMRHHDLTNYLPNHNLLYTDKISMAVGVEVRVPFLDNDVVQAALAFPQGLLYRGWSTKAVLREAAKGMVPKDIIRRPKVGFGAPYRSWLRYELRDMWEDLTSESVVRSRGWFEHKALKNARKRGQAGLDDSYMLQWAVIVAELWGRAFLDVAG